MPVEELLRELPALIVASVRGFAAGGPWSEFKSLDFVGQAVGGAMSVTGSPDGPPVRLGVTIADSGSGLHLAVGILAALFRRTRTGRGGRVDVALQDTVVSLMRNALAPTYMSGQRRSAHRQRVRHLGAERPLPLSSRRTERLSLLPARLEAALGRLAARHRP